jgi:hypothetical protein
MSTLWAHRTTLKNDLLLEAAFGQAQGYVDQYFAKASYKFDVAGNPLSTSYQFYGSRDKADNNTINDIYDGTAWLQALTLAIRSVRWIYAWGPGSKRMAARAISTHV